MRLLWITQLQLPLAAVAVSMLAGDWPEGLRRGSILANRHPLPNSHSTHPSSAYVWIADAGAQRRREHVLSSCCIFTQRTWPGHRTVSFYRGNSHSFGLGAM